METKETIVSESDIFDGKIIKVKKYAVSLPDGKTAEREEVLHCGGACALAVFEGKVYFVSQFRLSAKSDLLEIPAGKLNEGEDPETTARRELVEEVGLYPERLVEIASVYASPGYSNEILHVYLAEGLKKVGQKLDEDEFLNVVAIPVNKALEMLDRGEFKDAKTVIALYYLKSVTA